LNFGLGFLGFVALVAVRVVLHRQLAIGLFDLVFAGVFRNAENFVKIAFGPWLQRYEVRGCTNDFAACPPESRCKRGDSSSHD
jgi:hypothetical protein